MGNGLKIARIAGTVSPQRGTAKEELLCLMASNIAAGMSSNIGDEDMFGSFESQVESVALTSLAVAKRIVMEIEEKDGR